MALARLNAKSSGRIPAGQASEIVISDSSFIQQHRAFERAQAAPSKKRKREARGDAGVVYGAGAYKGPWAKYEERRPDANASDDDAEDVDEYDEVEVVYEEDEAIPAQPAAPTSKAGTAYEDTGDGNEASEFHGSEMYDYQGRTYMHVPQDLGHIDLRKEVPLDERKNYVPKKLVHTWKMPGASSSSSKQASTPGAGFGAAASAAAAQKAITQLRFFPDYGHLLLTASSDAKIRLWDVYHQRELLRSYSGHRKAVADIDFTADGRHFFSGAYDRTLKQWDTETGACITRISPGATPHVLRTNPASPSEFLVGLSDKRILQFDVRVAPTADDDTTTSAGATLKPTQDYNYHLGAVNTLTFVDEARRFISTSDDRSLRAWEYGIPVPIKLVSEPEMYALTRAAPHPNGKHVLFQSADNQILVYDTAKFRQHRKKSFRGHNTAGYSVDVAVSPDGSLVASGDSAGLVCFWDWKTCKMFHKISVGDRGVAQTCVAWQPKESSKVAVGGLDSVVRYYD